jgi:hypothetical protein
MENTKTTETMENTKLLKIKNGMFKKLLSTKKVIWDMMGRIGDGSITKDEILEELDREIQLINDELGYQSQFDKDI